MRTSIRISAVLWAVLLLAGLAGVISRALTFRRIFYSHSGLAVTQREAYELYHNGTWSETNRTQSIPKIIHQVFHNWDDPDNDTLPADWDAVRRTCIDKNPGFEYRLWTTTTSRDLIATRYPFFLRTYDSYRHPIQRVDAARYFILLHHGGIYLDLDNGCKTDLTPLLYFSTWTCDPGRGALSNNILASEPNHPFWMYLTQKLVRYNRDYGFPYVTISWASGQWFESAVWEAYHDLLGPAPSEIGGVAAGEGDDGGRLYRIMMDDRAGADEWVFFTQERGGSWINWDNRLFLWIGDHLGGVFVMGLGGAGILAWVGGRLWRKGSTSPGRVSRPGSSSNKRKDDRDTRGRRTRRGSEYGGHDYEGLRSDIGT